MAKMTERIVHAITTPLWRRDKLQMEAADAVLALIESKPQRRRRRASATKRRSPKRTR